MTVGAYTKKASPSDEVVYVLIIENYGSDSVDVFANKELAETSLDEFIKSESEDGLGDKIKIERDKYSGMLYATNEEGIIAYIVKCPVVNK
jgi:hypothetical protein